jgi:hypothetical protein
MNGGRSDEGRVARDFSRDTRPSTLKILSRKGAQDAKETRCDTSLPIGPKSNIKAFNSSLRRYCRSRP